MSEKTPWWKNSVVYQVYPRSFQDSNGDGVGDLNGVRQRLPYLKTLGIDVIWLNPIYVSPQVDNGYDISNYFDIAPELGTMADFDALLAAAHGMGVKLILDLVVNHTSDQHPWFQRARTSRDDPYHDYYIWKDAPKGTPPNNWGASFGGPAWEYVDEVAQYYLHCFAAQQPDLNWENPEVRRSVYDVLRFWLNKGIDGFRMDVISLISKDPAYPDGPLIQNKPYGSYYAGCASGPRIHEYLREMNEQVLSRYDVMTVGETPHTDADQAQLYTAADRHELNMVFHFDHMHLDYGENGKYSKNRFKLTDLKAVMTEWQEKMYACGGWNSLYWSNHDQPRPVTRFGDERPAFRAASAKMLGTVLHMLQGTPYIFEGEELGMTNVRFASLSDYRDVETFNTYEDFTSRGLMSQADVMECIYLKSRDNARTPMPWDGSETAGFTTGTPWIGLGPNAREINVKNALADPDSVFYYYQKLIALRHDLPVVTEGRYELLDPDNERVYAYLRRTDRETLVVVANFTAEPIPYCLDALGAQPGRLILSNDGHAPERPSAALTLAPYGAYVYLLSAE